MERGCCEEVCEGDPSHDASLCAGLSIGTRMRVTANNILSRLTRCECGGCGSLNDARGSIRVAGFPPMTQVPHLTCAQTPTEPRIERGAISVM
eukprot:scaffold105177_cov35-Tisochrysis_lutea.AAC.2